MSKERLFRIGLPNRGRLGNICRAIFINDLRMLHESVMDSRRYFHDSRDRGVEFIFARSKDLPRLVAQGAVDVCITGKDYVEDSEQKLVELLDLDLCPGYVSILVPIYSGIKEITDLQDTIIATQLPNIAKRWLEKNNLTQTKILLNEGANEVFPHLGLAHATMDMVSTGDTAKANDLIPIIRVLYSSGRLFTNEDTYRRHKDHIDNLVASLTKRYLKR